MDWAKNFTGDSWDILEANYKFSGAFVMESFQVLVETYFCPEFEKEEDLSWKFWDFFHKNCTQNFIISF